MAESPCSPAEQLARLRASSLLVQAKISFVVWGEDALAMVHHVPMYMFDQHLLVQDEHVADAVAVICNELNYSVVDTASNVRWRDYKIYNPARPFAFGGTPTTLLQHSDPQLACETLEPERILVHAASTFRFPLQDLSRSCLNPSPPSPESAEVRFPTVPAFYDSLLDMIFEPPLEYVHFRSYQLLGSFVASLTTYNVSEEGITKTDAPLGEFGLIPSCLQVLDEVKDENKPHLARLFLEMPLDRELVSLERLLIRQARLKSTGVAYTLPPLPYNPYKRSKGEISPTPTSKLLEQLRTSRIEDKLYYDCIRKRWPWLLRGLHL